MNGTFMAAEIREQPDVFRHILRESEERIGPVAAAIKARKPRFALLAARGTSDNAALYAKYLIETLLEMPAGLISPSTATLYRARPSMRDVLFIAVSQSGASPDLVEPLAAARTGGGLTLAVTNAPASPLAQAAEYCIDVLAGPERAVAATKTYTAQLLSLYLFVEALAGHEGSAARDLPQQAERVLDVEPEVGEVAHRYRSAEQMVVTSRGYNYATAREAALKLMETSYIVAHAFSGADLLHGPMAMIRRGFRVIVVAPGGAGGAALRPVLERLRERHADVLVVGTADALTQGTVGIEVPASGPEALSPLLTILPLQQLAWHLARLRGADPDAPEGLTKVTETR